MLHKTGKYQNDQMIVKTIRLFYVLSLYLPVRGGCRPECSDAGLSRTPGERRVTPENTSQKMLWRSPLQHMNQHAGERK